MLILGPYESQKCLATTLIFTSCNIEANKEQDALRETCCGFQLSYIQVMLKVQWSLLTQIEATKKFKAPIVAYMRTTRNETKFSVFYS